MTNERKALDTIFEKLPVLCRVKDLVALGVYASDQAAYLARRDKSGPPFMRIARTGIVYPREALLDWLLSK